MGTRKYHSETPNDQKLTFTYEETARAANVSVSLVRKRVRKGALRVVRIGRCVRVPRSEVLRLCGVSAERALLV